MKKKLLWLLSAALLTVLAGCAGPQPIFTPPAERPQAVHEGPWPKNRVLVLAYHDISDAEPDQRYVTTRTANFVAQMRWLKINHYVPVSMDQIFAAQAGKADLPEKAVLLTFDDGYRSMYDRVFPLLKRNHWPAVFAPVGAWLDTPPGQMVDFSGQKLPRDHFVTWDQVREMSDSGLVEVGSHTQNMHFGVLANPQGNVEPAASSLRYDPATKRYESSEAFRARIDQDARQITATITRVTGKPPRVWIWPYGAASGIAIDVIKKHHYLSAMTLEDGLLDVNNLMNVPRLLVANDPEIDGYAANVIQVQERANLRTVRIDLDDIYSTDPQQMEDNVGRVVQRLEDMQPDMVFIKGFVTPQEPNGQVKEVYFPNSQLPMRVDLFNRVVHQVQSRILRRVPVYAWLPTLSAQLGDVPLVQAGNATGASHIASDRPRRMSPFDPNVMPRLKTLYHEMAIGLPNLEGVMFGEDFELGADEDRSAPAQQALHQCQSMPDCSPRALQRHTLDQLAHALMSEVRAARGGDVKVARALSAEHYVAADAQEWLSTLTGNKNLLVLRVAPQAQPLSVSAARKEAAELLAAARRLPQGMKQTLFEVERVDAQGHSLTNAQLQDWLTWLANHGALNVGYTPDSTQSNQPALRDIAPFFETHWVK